MKPTGRGFMVNSQQVKEGWFNESELFGQSRVIYIDGKIYEGESRNDVPHGQGRMVESEKELVGVWSEGTMCGQGQINWSEKGKFEGQFLNGKRHGIGERTFKDGSTLKGPYLNGKKHGTFIKKTNGETLQSEWIEGEP